MRTVFLAAMLLAGSARADTNGVAAFLDTLGRTTAKAETLFVAFSQERHLALFDQPLRTEGYLVFRKPNSVRWEVTKPYRSILICAANSAAQFEQTDGTWKRLDLSYVKSIPNFVSGMAVVLDGRYLTRPEDYEISLRQENGPVLVLKPRQQPAAQFIAAFELQFGTDLHDGPRQVTLRQPDGDWTSIQFTNQIANASLPPGTFDLQSPVEIAKIREAVRGASR